jgi:D-glycero-D-manno-heptose 1,7-bisphosphate phosphatase
VKGTDTSSVAPGSIRAVVFDRDGTLIVDVPYNGNPDLVAPVPGALEAVAGLRELGVPMAVASNQSAIGLGMISREDAERVNRQVDRMFGGFDAWLICPHRPDEGCRCRKPAPGMVLDAAEALGASADELVVVGDRGVDMRAAHAAGALGALIASPANDASGIYEADLVLGELRELISIFSPRQGAEVEARS